MLDNSDQDEQIHTVEAEINKIEAKPRRLEHYYYKRPTSQDVLFEENDNFIQNNYQGRFIYE